MSAHTQGPWIFYADVPSTDPNWHIVTTANKMRVLANVHIEPGNKMDEANAKLIAAAPELLAALQDMLAEFGNQRFKVRRDFSKMVKIEAARKAIAKAAP